MPKSATRLVELETRIFTIRGLSVLLDSDLAELYGVDTKALLQAMRRNADRFPQDFVFSLTEQEVEVLRSQIVTSKPADERGGRRYTRYAFTEQGVAMLSSVLRSATAVQVNIAIMRAFVRLRRASLIICPNGLTPMFRSSASSWRPFASWLFLRRENGRDLLGSRGLCRMQAIVAKCLDL
jgi:hypothetical protein